MLGKILAIAVLLVLSACVEVESVVPPQIRMQTSFAPTKIDSLKKISEEFSSEYALEFEVAEGEILTKDLDGLTTVYITLLFKKDPVVVLTSAGDATSMMLIAVDFGVMPLDHLKEIVDVLKSRLESELDLNFEHRMEPWTTNLTSD